LILDWSETVPVKASATAVIEQVDVNTLTFFQPNIRPAVHRTPIPANKYKYNAAIGT
jgi:hypothetical protein